MELREATQLIIVGKENSILNFNDLKGLRFSLNNDSTQVILYLYPSDEKTEI
jgi:hypothetical protein